jgi:hypothetical protein
MGGGRRWRKVECGVVSSVRGRGKWWTAVEWRSLVCWGEHGCVLGRERREQLLMVDGLGVWKGRLEEEGGRVEHGRSGRGVRQRMALDEVKAVEDMRVGGVALVPAASLARPGLP